MREKLERGDVCEATVLRWERCVKYLEEFLLDKEGVKDIPMKKLTSGIVDDFEHHLRVKKGCANNAAVKYIGKNGKLAPLKTVESDHLKFLLQKSKKLFLGNGV